MLLLWCAALLVSAKALALKLHKEISASPVRRGHFYHRSTISPTPAHLNM
jgi:hypothetical protein